MSSTLDPVLASSVRLVSPVAVLVGTYLLFAGHNSPGGGFAAGLVFSAIIILRVLAGFPDRVDPTALISSGVLIVVAVAALPLVLGEALLDQGTISAEVILLGKVKSGSALPFDIGVTAIVVGLVSAFLRGLNASSHRFLLKDES